MTGYRCKKTNAKISEQHKNGDLGTAVGFRYTNNRLTHLILWDDSKVNFCNLFQIEMEDTKITISEDGKEKISKHYLTNKMQFYEDKSI